MSDVDRLIEQALDNEDRALREVLGKEPGFFNLAFGLFSGPRAWVNWILMAAQTALFFIGVWLAWQAFNAEAVADILRWGLSASTLLLAAVILKLSLVPVMMENRLVTEIRRLELRIERMRAER
ncbi:MAG: hypothetical protein JJU26_05315 [Oceanicaulis sp.]|uniref:DUF6768 family protein n=1 Tax=Glycocaulis sp. TaxID=1969725 RepID=UPI0025BD4563|nr:DUF6768 family protein [Glycocaulis sp.]MCC5981121.1 hypothetical protein [Oceanicaulis sp.]MCH8521872.1 hypothetical protein [Glycocaulis sp.]